MDIENEISKAKELNMSGKKAAGAGDFEKAAEFFKSASEIYKCIDDSINMAFQLFSLANCYHSLKKNTEALDIYTKVYDLIKDNEKLLEYQAIVLNNLGHLNVSIDDYDKAGNFFKKALGIYETIKNETGKALQLQNIASVHRDLKENKQALEAYFKSIEIFEKTEDRLGEGDQCTNIAYIYVCDNNVDEALKWYKKAAGIYRDIHEDTKADLTEKNIKQLEGHSRA